jgi:hypothetical protein
MLIQHRHREIPEGIPLFNGRRSIPFTSDALAHQGAIAAPAHNAPRHRCTIQSTHARAAKNRNSALDTKTLALTACFPAVTFPSDPFAVSTPERRTQ